VSRARPTPAVVARRAGVIGLVLLAAACTGGKLDAGHDNPPDAAPPTGLLDNLVGHWRLDDGTGSTTAFDSSLRGNNGVLHNLDPAAAWVAGRSQGALQIAHAGWVQVAPSPSIDAIVDRVTFCAWINLEGAIDREDIFATALSRQTGATQNQHYHLSVAIDGHPTVFVTTEDGYKQPIAPDTVPRDTWTHIAGVYDGATVRIYVNGVEGDSEPLTGERVEGMSDEDRVQSRARTGRAGPMRRPWGSQAAWYDQAAPAWGYGPAAAAPAGRTQP
jgi:hypothetical protein